MAYNKRDNELLARIESNIENGNVSTEDIKELIKKYKSATYGEYLDRHEFYEDVVESMVNDCGFRDKELAEKMANDHPTLQQSFMRMVVAFIRKMAEKTYYDGRNEKSVLLAKKLLPIVEETSLPFV